MVLKRTILLLLGVAGGIASGAVLHISAKEQAPIDTSPPVLVATEPSAATDTATSLVDAGRKSVYLPMQIPGTTLIAERLCLYDGPYLEDGSQREVMNVAALQVYNLGKSTILEVNITLFAGDSVLLFRGERIPPGATAALLECEGRCTRSKQFSQCVGWQVTARTEGLQRDQLLVTDEEMGNLFVTNLTAEPLQNIRVYYKCWLAEADILVGGIAYMVSIPQLEPGETAVLHPKYYVRGYSRIVQIVSDESV